jgi:hypothetical protein
VLPALRNVPHTNEAWSQWAFDHRDSHDRIRDAIQKKFGVNLSDYQIEPISPSDMPKFLQNNSQLHGDMLGTLKLQSSDLEDIDLKDQKQLQSWIALHYEEHRDTENALGI